MRQLFDHEPAAIEPGEQIVLARDPFPLGRVGQLEQQVRSCYLAFQRRDRYIQSARVTRCAGWPHCQLTIREALPGLESAAQQTDEPVRVLQKIPEGTAARLVQTECEQVLGGDVGVDRAHLRVEHDDARGQGIEQIRRIEVRERGRQRVLSGHG